jgi:hypothetical protein
LPPKLNRRAPPAARSAGAYTPMARESNAARQNDLARRPFRTTRQSAASAPAQGGMLDWNARARSRRSFLPRSFVHIRAQFVSRDAG